MATVSSVKAHCPTCGAKLTRTDLSLCAYCASPLNLGAKPALADDEVTRRLVRMRENAEFKSRLAANPIDREAEARASKLARSAAIAFALASIVAIVALVRGNERITWMIAIAWTVLAVILWISARSWRSKLRREPMLKRPALVVSRRSEMDSKLGATLYFFTLRFDDGAEGEFRFPGRGTQYDPMANGAAGIAYTRSDRLLEFHRITN